MQIPVDDAELHLLRLAARRSGVPLAQWARDLLRDEAVRTMRSGPGGPAAAAERLCGLGAPVSDVDTMIAESLAGRLL